MTWLTTQLPDTEKQLLATTCHQDMPTIHAVNTQSQSNKFPSSTTNPPRQKSPPTKQNFNQNHLLINRMTSVLFVVMVDTMD